MSCTSDPQHSAQKCFHNCKWHNKVIHASLGREMRGAEIKSFFFSSPQTISLLPLLELTMNKKYRSWRNVCGCKVPWALADVHWGVFSHPEGTGDTVGCIQIGFTPHDLPGLHQHLLEATGTLAGQGRPRQTSKMRRTKHLFEVPVGLPQPQRKAQ